ncbi:MAG: phosphotransferase [Halioglobus sp.]
MRPLPDDIRDAQPFGDFIADMAMLGVTPVASGGLRYAVIAGRSNPRWWLLPLEDRCAAAAGLEMLQPVTKAASIAKIVANGLARFGPHRLLGCAQMRLSGLPDLAGAFGGKAVHVAYFTGTGGPHRKSALQVMDAGGAILGYAKMSRASHVRPYLRKEAEILARVAELGLTTADVPTVLATRDDDEMTLLVTDSLKSSAHAAPLVPGVEHLAFLSELRVRTGCIGAVETLDALKHRSAKLAPLAGPEWMARLARVDVALRPKAEAIPVCLSHGDFTPWNTFLQDGQLYVFDWEYADAAWPVGFDLVHFHLAITPPTKQLSSLPALTQALAAAHFDGDRVQATRALLMSLACHAVFYLGRLEEAQSPLAAWASRLERAAMIDRLLAEQEASL